MGSLSRAFAYLIAAHVQAIGLIFIAIWIGGFLNDEYPINVNWMVITSLVAVVAIAQNFYVLVRAAMREDKIRRDALAKKKEEK